MSSLVYIGLLEYPTRTLENPYEIELNKLYLASQNYQEKNILTKNNWLFFLDLISMICLWSLLKCSFSELPTP